MYKYIGREQKTNEFLFLLLLQACLRFRNDFLSPFKKFDANRLTLDFEFTSDFISIADTLLDRNIFLLKYFEQVFFVLLCFSERSEL